MRFVIIFAITFYCLYHHVACNQQDPNDPNKPFWATRGRRSGIRASVKADDDILANKWQEEEEAPEILDKDISRRREQATSLLATLINALSSWDGEVVRKRGDGKPIDPNNPFWAARG